MCNLGLCGIWKQVGDIGLFITVGLGHSSKVSNDAFT